MVVQINERRGMALLAVKEVFVNAKNPGTRSAREFSHSAFDLVLVPAFNGGHVDVACRG